MVTPDTEQVTFMLSQVNKRIGKTREGPFQTAGATKPLGEQEVNTVTRERPTGWFEHPGRNLSGQHTPVSF